MNKLTSIYGPSKSLDETTKSAAEGSSALTQTLKNDKEIANRKVLRSLRRIVRAIDLYSRELRSSCGLTAPQLVCLTTIEREQKLTAAQLALQVHLSPSTLVGILDRLERFGLIIRHRNSEDRREVFITVSEKGSETVAKAPSPLQENLSAGLKSLPPKELEDITIALDRVVDIMEATHIRVAPVLTLERRSYAVRRNRTINRKK